MKKFMAIFTVLAVLLTSLTLPPMEAMAQDASASRGLIGEFLLTQAAKYNPGLSIGDIIRGYESGDLAKDKPATRAEAFAMISRAFGPLPQPEGGMKIMLPEAVSFDSMPSWAQADIGNIVDARILTEADALDGYISFEEVELLVQRIHSIRSESLRDDFYMTVNSEYIKSASILPGYSSEDNFAYVWRKVDGDIKTLIDEIVDEQHEKNTPGQKIADVYKNYLNYDARAKAGMEPVQKYVDALLAVKTLDELSEVCFNISEELAMDIFASFYLFTDLRDNEKKVLTFGAFSPSQTKDFYEDDENRQLFLSYYESVLKMAGLGEQFSKEAPLKIYNMEKEISQYQLEPQEYSDPEKFYNLLTPEELKTMMPNFDFDRLLTVSGYKTPDSLMVPDLAICEEFGRLYKEENLDLLKTSAIVNFLIATTPMLSYDFEKESDEFNNKLNGIEGTLPEDQMALNLVKETFSDYISDMYVEKYFSKEAKTDVERMCKEYLGNYKQRILNLSWMSGATKQKAIDKLDKIAINIGYPDKYDTEIFDNVVIDSFEDGGSLFDNFTAIRMEARKKSSKEQFLPYDKSLWSMDPFDVNAYYDPTNNSINFPAGILQPPFYEVNAKKESNYGRIGYVIGHEITHAFDNNGSKYDADGNFSDWWTEADYKAFSELTESIVAAYDEYEIYPGIENRGPLTLSENIADLGGIACSLAILGGMENPDYDTFFRSMASVWRGVLTRDYMVRMSATNVHSLFNARVNVTLRNFQEFYDTYGITEDDFMYTPPEKRVGIW